jgi:adenylate kinase
MEKQIETIKTWLGSGSINIFGLPLSGKDTVGKRLAEDLSGVYVSSGEVLRTAENTGTTVLDMSEGHWVPQQQFFDIVLPYFADPELDGKALVLGGVGRWSGEETQTMTALIGSDHETRVVIALELSDQEIRQRFDAARSLGDRGRRRDDADFSLVESRITEFREKTTPVLDEYQSLGLLLRVNAIGTRNQVYARVLSHLSRFASRSQN